MIKGCKETFFIACVGVFEMIRIFNYYLAPERDYKFPFKIIQKTSSWKSDSFLKVVQKLFQVSLFGLDF